MVVDDSPTVRAVMSALIGAEADLELAAVEGSAERALAVLQRTPTDVILLDLDMPGMGGLDAIPRLLAAADPARILVVSALTVRGADHTLEALSLGAADTLAKPRPGEFDDEYRALLLRKVRLLGRVARRVRGKAAEPASPSLRAPPRVAPEILAIGASTGGIHALDQFFGALPVRLPLPILVTQHLPATFSEALVRQLRNASGRGVAVARAGLALLPGHGCTPSVDPMFESCAAAFGANALGVVLSGMGRDGVLGAARVVEAGGTIVAQDAASSAVWGMPGAIAAAGLASALLPPEQIAAHVVAAMAVR
ncbi:MAG: hypothetical protein B7Z08_08475 [Sphingomonadales bacterium 32-68-7]|nr:MAG: hypothetical protein B7Z08_08475 [Sphingomonadales bacterium 32-68-7]